MVVEVGGVDEQVQHHQKTSSCYRSKLRAVPDNKGLAFCIGSKELNLEWLWSAWQHRRKTFTSIGCFKE
jgi:hypothetical protein